jgi:phosphinothricin acetyltransferase
MTAPVAVRACRAADLPAICAIVNHYIETTTINFRTEPQTPEEWGKDWQQYGKTHPWLVATVGSALAGLAYATPWKARSAYSWACEVTVYVSPEHCRRGIGSVLYQRLLALLDAQGYRTMVAVIGLPNDPSVALHEAFGFERVGTLREVGYKMGEWHDVGFWQRRLDSPNGVPRAVGPVPEIDG